LSGWKLDPCDIFHNNTSKAYAGGEIPQTCLEATVPLLKKAFNPKLVMCSCFVEVFAVRYLVLIYFVIGITNVSAMSATGVPRIVYEVVE
jgi:hypothetical protein